MNRGKWSWCRRGMSTLFSNFSDFNTLTRHTIGEKSSHSGVQNNTRAKRKINFANYFISYSRKPAHLSNFSSEQLTRVDSHGPNKPTNHFTQMKVIFRL